MMMKLLFFFVICLFNTFAFSQSKTITVSYSSSAGTGKKMTGVNTGPHSIISGTTEQCLQEIGTEVVRTHDYHGPCDYWGYTNFFDYANQTFDYSFQSHNPLDYNWGTTDAQITEIVNANLQPFFRVGISFPGGGFSPASPMPKDQDGINFHTFAGIAKRTAMHYTAGWNSNYFYTIPYWEVWNEPNNLASWPLNSASEYYKLYHQTVDSIKSFNPLLKVGGPAAAKNAFFTGGIHFTINPDYVSSFLNYCQSNTLPLDFYSFHMYDKKNPYNIKILADTLDYFLNQYNFPNTELIISETNINGFGGYENTAKGCSYLTSELISTVGTRLSKFIWYRGVDLNPLCNSDVNSTASLTLGGYAFKFFNEVNDSTPEFISASGSEFDNDNILDSLNNLMILSGKNSTNDLVKVLVSNHESVYSTLNVSVENLSWTASDQISVQIDQVTSAGYSTSTSSMVGSSTMNIDLTAVTDASVYLITLKKMPLNNLLDLSISNGFDFYPNPASTKVNIKTKFNNYNTMLLNSVGQVVAVKNNCSEFDVSEIPNGLYFIINQNENGETEKSKIVIAK
jgi:hypothetical protein